jgi:hypothetical protein
MLLDKPPLTAKITEFAWLHWFEQLYKRFDQVVTIPWAATITIDFSKHPSDTLYRCTLGGNTTVNISGGNDGQRGLIQLIQDGTGSRLVTLSSSFAFGTTIASYTATTTANKGDYLEVVYDRPSTKYRVIRSVLGY